MTAEEFIVQMKPSTFWDIDYDDINLSQQKQFIISRIFMRGDLPEIQSVLEFYGKEDVKTALTEVRYLDDLTLLYCSTIFKIPKIDFKCYIEKQLNPNFLGF